MLDIHCHILHEVDDGAKDLEEAVAMARVAYEDGVRAIIATPHFCGSMLTDVDIVMRKLEELQTELDRHGIGLTIHPGNEVRLESRAFLEEHKRNRRFAYLGEKGRFLLLEQRWSDYEQETADVVRSLLDEGVTPIIPHPERHDFFRREPELLLQLIEHGAWTQVSADSLAGRNGPEAASFAEWLSRRGYVHTIATDAHNVRRKPNLFEGLRKYEEYAGTDARKRLEERVLGIVR